MSEILDDEQAYLKRWYKFAKIHKTIPPPKKDTHLESLCYRIKIRDVYNIPPKKDVQQSIRILLNLYNSNTKEFFGRTYESPFLELNYSQANQQLEHPEVFCYFHLRQIESIQIAAEIVLFEKKDQVIQNRLIIGWCLGEIGQEQKYTLKRGSSRFLISNQTNVETVGQTLWMDIVENKEFTQIRNLVPEGCLCGYGDEVLGVHGYQIIQQLSLMQEQIAYVTSIEILVPTSVDLLISEYLKKYKEIKYKDDGPNDVHFLAKRLVFTFHNGWNYTNTRGLNNFITLEESSFQKSIDNQKIDYKKLTFKGALDVNGIYQEPKLGVFIIQLEYDVEFMVTNLGKQRTTVLCGWLPLVPKSTFEEEFIVGPGRSLSNQVLVDLSDIKYPITISGKINFGSIQSQNLPGPIINQQVFQPMDAPSLVKLPEQGGQQLGMDDDQRKIKQLENTLKQLQQDRQVSATNLAMDFENKLKIDKQKEQEYQKMVETIKKQHEEEIQKILEQYEDLKKMMTDINQTQQQYLTKAQPTSASLLGQQQVLQDQKELEKWRIIESMTSVPRKTFYKTQQQDLMVEAQFGGQALSRGDIAFLSQNGVRELFIQHTDYVENDEIKQKSLQYELADHRQSITVFIQLLSFKPRITMKSKDLEPTVYHYSEESRIPSRLFMIVNFYDFPEYITEPLIYENGFDKSSYTRCLEQSIPFLLIREQFLKTGASYKEPVFKFEIEPSSIGYPKAYKYFCEYLFNKCITIEIWDFDSMMIFGTIRLPLRQLLRQGQDASVVMRKADIIDKEFKKIKGELQVLIKCVGKEDKVTETLDNNSQMKRKVISTKRVEPLHVLEDEEKEIIKQDPNERIKERIKRIRRQEVPNDANTNSTKTLMEITKRKDLSKNAFVHSVIQSHLSDEKVIHPFFGKVEIIELEFRNPYATGQNFVISIDDQEVKCSGIQEIHLIHQPVEWKYYVDLYNHSKPQEFNMIQANQNNFTMFLTAKEKVVLLFKYQTFREVNQEFTELQKTEELFTIKGKQFLTQYSYPRQVAVFINTIEGQCVGGMRIKIFPHNNTIDHVYRFYERDNRQVSIQFPALYGYTVPSPDKKPILFCNNDQLVVEWANEFEIRISLRMPEVNKQTVFYILAYQDTYYKELIANWQIKLTSLAGIGIEVPLGQVQNTKLTVHVEISRQVKFYSSHPICVWFPQPYDQLVNLIPGKINIANLCVRLFTEQIHKVMVTCVDEQSHELVRGWILNISPTVPPISQVFDIQAPRDQMKTYIVKYANKQNNEVLLIFKSSNTQILKLIETRYLFKAQQIQDVTLQIHRVGEMDKAEVKVFIGDEDRSRDTFDCLLFRITYI
ncbi:unnamed protein product [Paramecium primaurelia]|uniref:Nephrocystin-4 n=1 Tax=Paramecium primaurelia TaxID=5886 RepID=A0A8S1MA12_PARPR|nr:unnamed protein product [Paramecium primaurelia]